MTKKDNGPQTYSRKRSHSKIINPQLEEYTEEELRYFKKMNPDDRNSISQMEIDLSKVNCTKTPLRFKILNSKVDEKIKAIAIQKLNYLYTLDESCSEYYRTVTWIENVCKIPFGKYTSLPVDFNSKDQEIRSFLNTMKDNLNNKVYGHKDAKSHIIRLLAQWIANPKAKGMVIGIHGPHGCGKTTLIKDGICQVLGLPFAFIPLGGANDGCYLEGHSYTYEGATWGKIVDVLMKTQTMNPVLFFDELDKVSDTNKGREIINILIHLTDSTQNDKVNDKYFSDFEFDLSRSLIIFSYNDASMINPVLKDRMICIETKGYTLQDKVEISQKHMIPAMLEEYGFKKDDVKFDNNVIKEIVNSVDIEGGVRNLKRGLQDIISNINLSKFLSDSEADTIKLPHSVSSNEVKKYVTKRTNEFYKHMLYT